jgi:hypothetical protein
MLRVSLFNFFSPSFQKILVPLQMPSLRMFAEKSSVAFRPVLDMPAKLKPLPPAATLPQDSGPSQQAWTNEL